MPITTIVDNDDLFVAKEDSFIDLESDLFGASFFILLRNFALNGHFLLPAHVEVLRERVAPFIMKPVGFAEIYGMTDRSGSRQINYQVSAERVKAVQDGLQAF